MLAGLAIPKPELAVLTARGDGAVLAADGNRPHQVLVALERGDQLPVRNAPEPECVVVARRHHPRTVRGESNAVDLGRVPYQRAQRAPARDVPDDRREISEPGSRDQA